jgi:hypothetical protein
MKTTTLIALLRKHCRGKRVTMRCRAISNGIHGLCYPNGKLIDINKKIREKAEIARTVFHELAHAECIKEGRYKKFHSEELPPAKTFYYENKVEHIAKKNWDKAGMRKLFGQYQFYYSKKNKKNVIEWIRTSD